MQDGEGGRGGERAWVEEGGCGGCGHFELVHWDENGREGVRMMEENESEQAVVGTSAWELENAGTVATNVNNKNIIEF